MLKRLHDASTTIQFVVILFVLLLLWVPRFIFPENTLTSYEIDNELFNMLFGWIGRHTALTLSISLIFILISALMMKLSLNYERLRISGNYFPVLIFIVFASGINIGTFSPQILLLLFLVWVTQLLFIALEVLENDGLLFFLAMFLGFASFFYPPVLIFLLFMIVIVIVSENEKFRKILLLLLAFIFPWIWIVAICYFANSLDFIVRFWETAFFIPKLPRFDNLLTTIYAGIFLIVVGIFVVDRFLRHKETLIIIRRRSDISVIMTIFIFIGAFFSYDFYEHLMLMAIPVTSMMAYTYHEGVKSRWFDYMLSGFILITIICSILNICP
ncbi:MAG: hypothetical protein LBH92_07110 [Bacteroidales bacterium]|jgi:hypothetical protein|nr:hypothetical protein [Bacteroidales bacterium]